MNSSMNEFDFTDDEIREQLELLGFKNVSDAKFNSFKQDLRKLIENEKSSEESQIFNQRLNKIQSEKLSNFNNETWEDDDDDDDDDDEDYSYNTDLSTQFPKGSGNYLNRINNVYDNKFNYENKNTFRTNTNNEKLKCKRKIARKTSSGVSQSIISYDSSKDFTNNSDHDDNYLNGSFEKLNINENNNENYDVVYSNDDILEKPIENQVKSFIRPKSSMSGKFEDPSRIKKSNPIRMYHDYAKIWSKQKAPGEKSHKDLRWSIREKMLEKHVVVKKQPTLQTENKYQIPTEKKRQDLRWIIRNAMAYNSVDSK